MSSKSNDQGRAFEYACIVTLAKKIVQFREYEKVVIEKNKVHPYVKTKNQKL